MPMFAPRFCRPMLAVVALLLVGWLLQAAEPKNRPVASPKSEAKTPAGKPEKADRPKLIFDEDEPRPAAKAAPAKESGEEDQKEESQFLRVVRDGKKKPIAMEAAIVSYAPRDCGRNHPTVDLVSAVHIGEKAYYDELNRVFEQYDVVLYELVAPEGTRVPKGGGKGPQSAVSRIQSFMTDVLHLEFQLRAIDYTKQNLVHADMSPDQFDKAMEKRGETFFTMFMRMWGYTMTHPRSGNTSDTDILAALLSKDRPLLLKRALAEQFFEYGGSLDAISGPDGSAIITDRNSRALEVLRKQIDGGKKKIAIFYGAGHMPDFDKRLRADFALSPITTRWLVAWDSRDPAKPK